MLRNIIYVLNFLLLSAAAEAQQVTLPSETNAVRFAVIGDAGTGENLQYETARKLAQAHDQFHFDFVLMVGDNIYGEKHARDFTKKFEVPYKPLIDDKVTFYASLGNHDVPAEQFYKPFNMDGRRYYSFKKDNVRFFALDSNYLDPEQLTWLADELRSSTEEWKIAFFHHPLYSSAATHGSSVELRELLEPLFRKYGVQVVFSGHDHVYERILPQGGVSYFTEGSSGQLRRGDTHTAAFTAKAFDADCSFLLVEVTQGEVYFQAISRSGETVDSGKIPRMNANAQVK